MILWVSLNQFCINFNSVSIVLYFYDIDSANIEFSFPLSCDDSEERIRSIFFLPPFSRTLIKNNRQINLFHAFLFNRKEISNVNVIFPILSSATNRWNDIKKKIGHICWNDHWTFELGSWIIIFLLERERCVIAAAHILPSLYQRLQEFSLLIQLIMWRTNVGVLYDVFMGSKEKTLGSSEINSVFLKI